MRPSFDAKDFDPRLSKKAASATPIIATIQHYRINHGFFPPNLKAFRDDLPKSCIVDYDMVDDWRYDRSHDELSFKLVAKLGWDPSLIYEATDTTHAWTFDPGDGSEMKPVKFQP